MLFKTLRRFSAVSLISEPKRPHMHDTTQCAEREAIRRGHKLTNIWSVEAAQAISADARGI
jgi:hypothetical protein